MYCNALTMESYVARPQPDLGDSHMSPLFNRVSAACPVLSIFGYVRLPALDTATGHDTAAHEDGADAAMPPLPSFLSSPSSSSQHHPALLSSTLPPPVAPRAAAERATPPLCRASPHPAHPPPAAHAGCSARTTGTQVPPPSNRGAQRGRANTEEEEGAPLGAGEQGEPREQQQQQWSVCVHVHGCYPYFLVPQYDRSISAVQFGAQLETVALRTLFQRPRHQQQERQGMPSASSARNPTALRATTEVPGTDAAAIGERLRQAPQHGQLLHDVEVVERVPFYGYHAHTYPFYKIQVMDPTHVKLLADLLQETSEVGGRSWQLYEAHCSYHSQFMIDYDVKGISTFQLPLCHVRAPVGGPETHQQRNSGARALATALQGQSPAWLRDVCGVASVRAPDEGEGRRTEAELEVDISAEELRAVMLGASPAAAAAAATVSAATTGVRGNANGAGGAAFAGKGVEPGSHLAHVRTLVRQYFAESGVPDHLRQENTIATELRRHEAWRRGEPVAGPGLGATDGGQGGGHSGFLPRYGPVTVIQRCDPVARSLRRQMLVFLRARLGREGRASATPQEALEDGKAVPKSSAATGVKKQGLLPHAGGRRGPPPRRDSSAWANVNLPMYLAATQAAASPTTLADKSAEEDDDIYPSGKEGERERADADGTPTPLTFELMDALRGGGGRPLSAPDAEVAAALASWSSPSSVNSSVSGDGEDAEGEGNAPSLAGHRPHGEDGDSASPRDAPHSRPGLGVGDCVVWLIECTYTAHEGQPTMTAVGQPESHETRRATALLRYAVVVVMGLSSDTARVRRLGGLLDGDGDAHYSSEEVCDWVRQRRWLAPTGRVASLCGSSSLWQKAGAVGDCPVYTLGELVLLQTAAGGEGKEEEELPLSVLLSQRPVILTEEQLKACNETIRDGGWHVVLHQVSLLPPTRVQLAAEPSSFPASTAHTDGLLRSGQRASPGGGTGVDNAEANSPLLAVTGLCRYRYVSHQRRLAPLPARVRRALHLPCVALTGTQPASHHKEKDMGSAPACAASLPEPLHQTERGEAATHKGDEDTESEWASQSDEGDEGDVDAECVPRAEDAGLAAGLAACADIVVDAVRAHPESRALLPVVGATAAGEGLSARDVRERTPLGPSPFTPSPSLPLFAHRPSPISKTAEWQQLALTQFGERALGQAAVRGNASSPPVARWDANEVSFRSDEPLFLHESAPSLSSSSSQPSRVATQQEQPALTVTSAASCSPPQRRGSAPSPPQAAPNENAPPESPITVETTTEDASVVGMDTYSNAESVSSADDTHGSAAVTAAPFSSHALRLSRAGADIDGMQHLLPVSCAAPRERGRGAVGRGGSAEPLTGPGEPATTHDAGCSAPPRHSAVPPLPAATAALPSGLGSGRRDRSALSVSQLQLRTCRFRVVYVEVIIHRTPGTSEVAGDEVLAVALGATTTDRDRMRVRLFTVGAAAPGRGPAPAAVPGFAGRVEQVELADERSLLRAVARAIVELDPDIIMSWEGFKYGLGFLALRYQMALRRSLSRDLSRFRSAEATAGSAEARKPSGLRGAAEAPGTADADNATDHDHRCQTSWAARTEVRRAVSDAQDASRGGDGAATRPHLSHDESSESWRGGGDAEAPSEGEDDAVGGDSGDPDNTGPAAGHGYGAGATGGTVLAVQYAKRFGAAVRVPGRVCRSLGKDLRKQVKSPSHTLAMVHQVVLGESLPYFTDAALARLFLGGGGGGGGEGAGSAAGTSPFADRLLALSYLVGCCVAAHRIARAVRYYLTATEFSAMYGILFEEVISRGSQFRVEATLIRMARPLNYALLSSSRMQVLQQPRIQHIPLVMQPRSGFYGSNDPVIVLDFRSLYPSIAIAYNLCYSTCVGLVQPNTYGRLGVLTRYKEPNQLLDSLLPETSDLDDVGENAVTISPNGAMFLSAAVRKGVLPQMLQAVLDTRFEVQAAIKHVASPMGDTAMAERLTERQQALKMLANVTYGYTGASFTGRMPCVDVAEAIVSLGRQTLERAIALIHGDETWGTEVVYGDTDSIFVRVGRGRSIAEAFAVGAAIAKAVTASNPVPVQLQLEKVLCPCLLVVKKRYAGYAWLSADQAEPVFLDKGIETVRRDQCPATARITRQLLTHLFDSGALDVHGAAWRTTLRARYQALVAPMLRGEGSPADYIFRRAVKLGRYGDDDSHLPLAARLALQRMEQDLLATPHWGERLSYVVVQSLTSARLRDQVAHPEALLLLDAEAVVDVGYYMERHINSTLDRLFYLVGVSFAGWYRGMPKGRRGRREPLQVLTAPPPTLVLAPAMAERLHGLLSWLHQHHGRADALGTWGGGGGDAPPLPPRQLTSTSAGWLRAAAAAAPASSSRRAARPMKGTSEGPVMVVDSCSDGSGEDADESEDKEGMTEDGLVAALCPNAARRKRARQPAREAPRCGVVPRQTRLARTEPSVVNVDREEVEGQDRRHPCWVGRANPRASRHAAVAGKTSGKGSATPRPQRARTTLEDYYPTTLCVVCNSAIVAPEAQVRPFAHYLRQRANTTPTAWPGSGDAIPRANRADQAVPPPLLPPLDDVSLTLPPICGSCIADPVNLLCCVRAHTRAVGTRLHRVQAHCLACLSSLPPRERQGPGATTRAGAAAGDLVVDVEELVSGRSRQCGGTPIVRTSLPPERAASVASLRHPSPPVPANRVDGARRGEGVAGGDLFPSPPPIHENELGCASCDCRLNFEKRHLTLLFRQMQLLQDYVERVLS